MKKFYFLASLFVGFSAFSQTTYQYQFNNNLNESGSGPALTDTLTCGATTSGYSSQTVCAGPRTVFNFNAGEGLVFRNDPSFLNSSSSYTINILMKYNSLTGTGNPSGAQRIITFDTATNMGLYSFPPSGAIPNGVVHFYDGVIPPSSNGNKEILANTFFLYSIVRIGGGVDSVYFYINGAKSDSSHDTGGYLEPVNTPAPFWFFVDNGTTGGTYTCEDGPGSISYLSITDGAFSAAQVDSTWKAQCPGVLPLRLLDFHADKQAGSVALSWTTANEVNTSNFELERGSDGIHFSSLASIPTHNNTSTNNYSFVDQNPLSTNYYRLKMVDIDGKFTYSSILKINFNGSQSFEVYPNPARNSVTINGLHANESVKLFSSEGKLLMQRKASGQSMTLDISNYSRGVYILQYFDGNSLQNRKLVKE